MRLLQLLLVPCLATAGVPTNPGPRLPSPTGLQVRHITFPWLKADPARRGSRVTQEGPFIPVGRPRLDLPLIPYPDQVPPKHRGFLHAN